MQLFSHGEWTRNREGISKLKKWRDPVETELLRYFRDTGLNKTPEGQEMIRLYYALSPLVVKVMKEDSEFKEEVKGVIDAILYLMRGEVK